MITDRKRASPASNLRLTWFRASNAGALPPHSVPPAWPLLCGRKNSAPGPPLCPPQHKIRCQRRQIALATRLPDRGSEGPTDRSPRFRRAVGRGALAKVSNVGWDSSFSIGAPAVGQDKPGRRAGRWIRGCPSKHRLKQPRRSQCARHHKMSLSAPCPTAGLAPA
jgi:hypothetical protein